MLPTSEPQPDQRWAFADCEIDVPARTIVRAGQAQTFEPKVFDLIVHLVNQRHRVVPQRELLEHVWGRRVVVSGGVVARTVMKARRVIGDDAAEPTLIRTVHRVGYRFAVDVRALAAPDDDSPRPAFGSLRPRVAVLPYLNPGDDAALGWIALGLMSTTGAVLAGHAGFDLMPAGEVLAALGAGAAPAAAPPRDPAQHAGDLLAGYLARAARALAATDVLAALVERRPAGDMVVHYRAIGQALASLAGELAGSDLLRSARHLGELAHAALISAAPASAGAAGTAAAGSDAAYIAELRARADAAMQAERWDRARKHLRVLLDMQPGDNAAGLELGRCLVRLRDPAAGPLLEALLVRETMPARRLRLAHQQALCRLLTGDPRAAEAALAPLLEEAERCGDREAELELLVSMAETTADHGSEHVTEWLLQRAEHLARALGDAGVVLRVQATRGRIAAEYGRIAAAGSAFAACWQLAHDGARHGAAALVALAWSDVLLGQGRVAQADELLALGFEHALAAGDPMAIAEIGLRLTGFGGLPRPAPVRAAEVLGRMRQAGAGQCPAIDRHADLAEAMLAAADGQLAASLDALERAAVGADLGTTGNFAALVGRCRVQVLACAGFADEAEDAWDELERSGAMPGSIGSGRRAAALAAGVARCTRAGLQRLRGDDALALASLHDALAHLPSSLQRINTAIDAAWLSLEDGQAVLPLDADLQAAFDQSLADAHPPMLLVAARGAAARGAWDQALAWQQQFIDRLPSERGSDALQLLSAYRHHKQPGRIRALPSLCAVMPGLGLMRRAAP